MLDCSRRACYRSVFERADHSLFLGRIAGATIRSLRKSPAVPVAKGYPTISKRKIDLKRMLNGWQRSCGSRTCVFPSRNSLGTRRQQTTTSNVTSFLAISVKHITVSSTRAKLAFLTQYLNVRNARYSCMSFNNRRIFASFPSGARDGGWR